MCETRNIPRDGIVDACKKLKAEGFDFLIDLCGVHYPGRTGAELEVVYHLLNLRSKARLRLKAAVSEADANVPSVTGVWKAADWFERECFDMFGVRFTGHPNLKRLLLFDGFEGHPLRKDYPLDKRPKGIPIPDPLTPALSSAVKPSADGHKARGNEDDSSYTFVNFGPSHPSTHGAFRLMLKLDGERIEDAIPEIGYLHRCFEKEAEDHTYTQVIPYTDRLNYCSCLMNNVGWCMAVEKLLRIGIPERAQYIRILISELSRIIDHLVAIGANVVDIGALTNFWYTFNIREFVYDWIERLCGARMTTTYTRIGGVVRDIPADTKEYIPAALKKLDRAVRDVTGLLLKNRIYLERTVGVGVISCEDAVSYGWTGPCARASGVDYDVRRDFPYYGYEELDWEVPLGENGDTYDRIMVRLEEIRQSARIVEQVLEKLPDGPVMTEEYKTALPAKADVYGSIEGLMDHFKLIMDGITPTKGEVYSFTEAANGELGFYIVSDGGKRPYRVKVRPPCYVVYQAYPDMIRGHMIADAVAVLGSLNVIAGELDR